MLTLILALCILGLIISIKFAIKYPRHPDKFTAHETFLALAWVLGIISLCLGISIVAFAVQVATKDSIDDKIAYYEAENAELETELKSLVEIYIAQEPEKYANIPEDYNAVALANYFKELNNTVSETTTPASCIKNVLYDYNENEAQISKLKKSKTKIAQKAWLVYFSTDK